VAANRGRVCVHVAWRRSLLHRVGLRFDFDVPDQYRDALWTTLPFVWRSGSPLRRVWPARNVWQRVSLTKPRAAASAATLTFHSSPVLGVAGHLHRVPRSVLLIDWLLGIFLCGGV
jgi:hypothetical protein